MIAPVIASHLPAIYFADDGKSDYLQIKFLKNTISFSEIEYKIYTLNNQEITNSFESDEQFWDEDDKNILYLYLTTYENQIPFSYYKITIRQRDREGITTPWSNFGIFKLTSEPIIDFNKNLDLSTRCNYNYSSDPTEPPETLEYYYVIDGKPQEIKSVYFSIDSEYNKTCELDSLFNYSDFREESFDDNHSVQLYTKTYTKNGIFNYDKKNFGSIRVYSRPGEKIVEISTNPSGNNLIKLSQAREYLVGFNNGIRIFNNNIDCGKQIIFIDYSAKFINNYEFFINSDEGWIKEIFFIINEFDGSHLIDIEKDRMLNITLNNKLNSFKSNRLEQKTDTIGGQYPIFFRNAQSNYREFPLSGTISYQSMVFLENDFCNLKELGFSENTPLNRVETKSLTELFLPSLSLTAQNIYAERVFREKVLEFLLENRPLLFKSPTEGDIVVKLMNISLTPNQQLGRMIYDFSCTCYETQSLESYLLERGNRYESVSEQSKN